MTVAASSSVSSGPRMAITPFCMTSPTVAPRALPRSCSYCLRDLGSSITPPSRVITAGRGMFASSTMRSPVEREPIT